MNRKSWLSVISAFITLFFSLLKFFFKLSFVYVSFKLSTWKSKRQLRLKLRKRGLEDNEIEELCKLADVSFGTILSQIFQTREFRFTNNVRSHSF
ncbi:MAG: hypothetical protein GWN31_16000 [Candidatus Thorarchaeota archaeon]|nr:hypothetical protein [Candidatus Thorarchaeota archaeon]